MNFLPATVKGDAVELPFGTVKIPKAKADKVAESGLLIAGIRPEYFEDASVMDASKVGEGSTFRATVDVTEWLGNEAYAYIPFEAPPEVQKQLQQLERDLDGEVLRTQLVVSLDSSSRIKAGEEAEIYVDSSKMHLFEPASGDNLTLGPSRLPYGGVTPLSERLVKDPSCEPPAAGFCDVRGLDKPIPAGRRRAV